MLISLGRSSTTLEQPSTANPFHLKRSIAVEPVSRARVHPRGGVLGQIALVAVAWVVYSFARSLSGDDVAQAIRNGRLLLDWDQALGFGWTLNLNQWATAHALVAVPFAFEYASLHYIVTPLVLVWLWRRRPEAYRSALTALLVMSAIGLAFYVLLPVAPPRLLPDAGWVDTMKSWSHVGWWGGAASAPAGFEHLTDQYAAMPSLHVGWAVWCAWAWRNSSHALVRRFGWLYPASIATAVVLTANHYVLDVAAGALIAITVCSLLPRLMATKRRPSDVRPIAPAEALPT
jgi:membrane-associated phospholipid phosphatase